MKKFWIGILFICLCSFSSAYILNEHKYIFTFQSDTVDIDTSFDVENRYIVSNSKIVTNATVKNKGASCYVRFYLMIEDQKDITNRIRIYFKDDEIVYHHGYYYVKKSLKEEERVLLFDELQFLDTFVEEIKEKDNFKVQLCVEAIQQQHFQPDYTLEDPWMHIPIQKTIHERIEVKEGYDEKNLYGNIVKHDDINN